MSCEHCCLCIEELYCVTYPLCRIMQIHLSVIKSLHYLMFRNYCAQQKLGGNAGMLFIVNFKIIGILYFFFISYNLLQTKSLSTVYANSCFHILYF